MVVAKAELGIIKQPFSFLNNDDKKPFLKSIKLKRVARTKSLLMPNCKGISAKYLNNHLADRNFIKFTKENKKDKEQTPFDYILNINCIKQSVNAISELVVLILVI